MSIDRNEIEDIITRMGTGQTTKHKVELIYGLLKKQQAEHEAKVKELKQEISDRKSSEESLLSTIDKMMSEHEALLDKVQDCITTEINLSNYNHDDISNAVGEWSEALELIKQAKK